MRLSCQIPSILFADFTQFYNLVCFMSSVAVFSLIAQRMSGFRTPIDGSI